MIPQKGAWAPNRRPAPQRATGSNRNSGGPVKNLERPFHNILKGYWKVRNVQSAQEFLESIVSQTDKTACLERLASSKDGQEALHKALTLTDSPNFMNKHVSDLLAFLEDPVRCPQFFKKFPASASFPQLCDSH